MLYIVHGGGGAGDDRWQVPAQVHEAHQDGQQHDQTCCES